MTSGPGDARYRNACQSRNSVEPPESVSRADYDVWHTYLQHFDDHSHAAATVLDQLDPWTLEDQRPIHNACLRTYPVWGDLSMSDKVDGCTWGDCSACSGMSICGGSGAYGSVRIVRNVSADLPVSSRQQGFFGLLPKRCRM